MANTRKTNTNKTTATRSRSNAAKTTKPVVEDFETDIFEQEEEVVKPVEKKVFHADDMILCRSMTAGKVVMEGDVSKNIYRWVDYGSECAVEYRDLVNAVRRRSTFVYAPRFIIEDEDFINEFSELKKFYTEQFTIGELTDIIDMDEDEMASAISVLPKGAKEELVNIVSTSISNGSLDSIRKIKTLEKILDVDFSFVAEVE